MFYSFLLKITFYKVFPLLEIIILSYLETHNKNYVSKLHFVFLKMDVAQGHPLAIEQEKSCK